MPVLHRTWIVRASLLFLVSTTLISAGQSGRTLHIISHNDVKVITDPSRGVNPYRSWTVFPSRHTQYRRAELSVTYRCPDSLHCGEWDYIDNIFLRRIGGVGKPATDIEIARLISPYGWRFTPTWKFTWKVDVTDFAFLLHDSVEVEFSHGGYETNTDRGWLITLDFALSPGPPAVECLGYQKLWQGSFPYGDSTRPIEDSLAPVSFTPPKGTSIARLRILQTGHGMDDSENCAEFCSKYRRVFFDDTLIDQKQIWRECGNNPLYPQAGTWIYPRAGWCPGSMVYPDVYDYAIRDREEHSVNVDMEPYINRSKPTASYYFSSYLFLEKSPRARDDVSLDEIQAPSTDDDFDRMNPVCSSPRIMIRNSGRDPLHSVSIAYGIENGRMQTYLWKGLLPSQKSAEVVLPGLVSASEGKKTFKVILSKPNGRMDEYPGDNAMTSTVAIPPTYPMRFILALRSNHDSTNNAYQLTDEHGAIVQSRRLGSLRANTLYMDTLDLQQGCYHFVVNDTAADGLDFWANPDGGFGYIRFLDMRGHLIKSFNSDFGSGIDFWFTAAAQSSPPVVTDTLPLVNAFPIRNPGKFHIEVFNNEPAGTDVTIENADSNATVFHQFYPDVKESFLPVDISNQPDGFYFVRVTANGTTATRKIRVRHKD